MPRVAIVSIYWGPFPEWFQYFVESCRKNSEIDFLIISDNKATVNLYGNIKYLYLTIDSFNQLASKQLGFKVNLENPYKICDYKPSYGIIFRELLESYEYWAYSDIDIIFGDINKFLIDHLSQKTDVISTYRNFLSGPFCIYRNIEKVNDLVLEISDLMRKLKDRNHFALDEKIHRKDNAGFTLRKGWFLVEYLFQKRFKIAGIKEFIYNFQWEYKKRNYKNQDPEDMTEVVWKAEKNGRISSVFLEGLESPDSLFRKNKKNWCFIHNNSGLSHLDKGSEIVAFHLKSTSTARNWSSPGFDPSKGFKINEKGIFPL